MQQKTVSFSNEPKNLAPPLGELARERLRGRGCYSQNAASAVSSAAVPGRY